MSQNPWERPQDEATSGTDGARTGSSPVGGEGPVTERFETAAPRVEETATGPRYSGYGHIDEETRTFPTAAETRPDTGPGPQPVYGEQGHDYARYGEFAQPQAPYGGDPHGQFSAYGHQPYGGPVTPTGPAPKRTGPILAIVLGFLTMLLAPLLGLGVAFGSMASGLAGAMDDPDALGNISSSTIADGGTVAVGENESAAVMPNAPDAFPEDCTATGPDGQERPVVAGDGVPGEVVGTFQAGPAGDYAVSCGSSQDIEVITGVTPEQVDQFGSVITDNMGGMVTPVLVGFLLGLLGLVVGIIGIVWLVRVNRRRRELGWS